MVCPFAVALVAPLTFAAAGCSPSTQGFASIAEADATLRPDGLPVRSERVELRHRWDSAFPGRDGTAVYRLRVPDVVASAPSALLFERVGNQVTVAVGDAPARRLVGGGSADAGRRPHVVDLPPGTGEVTVEAAMQALRGGGLSPVLVGSREAVASRYEWRRLIDQQLPAAYAVCLLLMGGLAAGLWWRQRDPLYGCFGLAALCGSVRHVDRLLLDPPLAWPLWGAMLAMAYGAHLALIARFVVMVAGDGPRKLVQTLRVVLFTTPLLAGWSFAAGSPAYWTGALVSLEIVGVACFAVVMRQALTRGGSAVWFVLFAGTLLLLAGLHDLLIVRTAVVAAAQEPLSPHALFIFVALLAGIVVERYSASVSALRALNDDLGRRIAEREAQLTQAFEALRLQREEQAAAAERQRIMRDIHDGVGSQLVGLMSLVRGNGLEAGQLEQHVQSALDELRMAVDSMQPVHGDLATVLATLRYRLQPRLRAAGIEVVWDVPALPPLKSLSPQSVLQVQRILLETLTNVVRHAQARSVTVSARCVDVDGEQPAIRLSVADDGIGIPDVDAARGHGLANIRARAQAIGATLDIASSPGGGTRIGLAWPVG
jgi:signal transduction histidine kinase